MLKFSDIKKKEENAKKNTGKVKEFYRPEKMGTMVDRITLVIFAAMSFPHEDEETLYRKSLNDVAKMLKSKHGENYMV